MLTFTRQGTLATLTLGVNGEGLSILLAEQN
ncbi:hypothetical protein L917_09191 [Phytophthora nicotianae]|uniref:Uncharacterized protein n=1 Tax=Phytophthora nicotianae TaxID=4792 RepID=W2J0U4_PHYNI|nr:hypothetical protein L915_09351 [Phytophthora nicotianae]ETL39407.1 hypothetical protein L916_09257 [Phytophthora nicotianae]ETL92530.1 hypothetical protein L917_09191 [Phytophthora nicotianae]